MRPPVSLPLVEQDKGIYLPDLKDFVRCGIKFKLRQREQFPFFMVTYCMTVTMEMMMFVR